MGKGLTWTEEEDQILKEYVEKGRSVKTGAKTASTHLKGRTSMACEGRYHSFIKKKKKQEEHNSVDSSYIITVHNGTSEVAKIIAHTDTLLVAQCGSIVITIQK